MKDKLLYLMIRVAMIILLIDLTAVSMTGGDEMVRLVQRLPVTYQDAVLEALQKAGDNQGELLTAIRNCPDDHRTALGFLLANMPERDLTSLRTEFLLENIAYAYKAMEAIPWGKDIPEAIFLNNVLPYMSIHERRDNWRKDFFGRFMPIVQECKTPGEACLKLNEVMWDTINVHYSTKRPKADQSPYESIDATMASCTGLAILLIDACRAVGVPARFVGIPLWTDKSGNHSWVEVWDQGWHFVGASESGPLDKTWFAERAAKTDTLNPQNWIYATSFKKTALHFPALWDSTAMYVYAENVTSHYVQPQDHDGKKSYSDSSISESIKEIMLKSVACKPQPRQIAWQQNEFMAFIHFGINTFTGREWGTGFEYPNIFQPEKLNTDQWCQTIKAAGMKMVIITAKHHDGFCLWQTRYTTHSVASSPWHNGRGDVVKELSTSCRKYGLKLGIYLSPADLYQIENPNGLYGNGSAYSERVIPRPVSGRPFKDKQSFKYIVDDYNEYYMNQLFELLTEYDPVFEVWLDGANPKSKGDQQYTYSQWYDLIRKLASEAVIFGKGPDIRWCGNEAGQTREAEWSVIPIGAAPENWNWPDMMEQNLGSLDKIKTSLEQGGVLHWYPAETNTSIRDGWFWRDEQQHVKTTKEILDIWYRSVGGNSVFLLNIPPNRDGLFSDRDVEVLEEVGQTLKTTFCHNLAKGAVATSSQVRGSAYKAPNMFDGDPITCWMPLDWDMQATVDISLPKPQRFNRLVLQEQIASFSQRIAKFAIDAWLDGTWQQIAEGTTVGYKRICLFNTITTDKLRIWILESRVCPTISNFELYYEPVRLQKHDN